MWFRLAVFVICSLTASSVHCADRSRARRLEELRVSQETTVIQSPLNELGYPDYVRALDEELSAGVSPMENFWAGFSVALPPYQAEESYLRKLTAHRGFEQAASQPLQSYLTKTEKNDEENRQLEAAMSRPWTASELPIIANWLDSHREPLAIITRAAARPRAYAPLITNSDLEGIMYAVALPLQQQTREAARAYACRAFLLLEQGRDDEAWQDVVTMYRISGHLNREPFLIAWLIGLAIESIARAPAEAVLADHHTTREELLKRWNEFSRVIPVDSSERRWLHGERLATLDAVLAIRSRRVYLSDLQGYESLGPVEKSEDLAIDLSKARKAFQSMMFRIGDINETLILNNRYHDRIKEALAKAEHLDRKAALAQLNEEYFGNAGEIGVGEVATKFFLGGPDAVERTAQRAVLQNLSSSFQTVNTAEGRVIARRRLMHAAFAAELHFRTLGHDVADAASLERAVAEWAIIADVEPRALNDPFSGTSLRIARDKNRLVLYSIGDNGRDDGGKTFGEGEDCDDLIVILRR